MGGNVLLVGAAETGTGGSAELDGPVMAAWIMARLPPVVGTTASYTCVVGRMPASCPFDHTGGRSPRGNGATGPSVDRRRLRHQIPPRSRIPNNTTPAMTGPTITPTFVFLLLAEPAFCAGCPVELLAPLVVELCGF